MSSARHVRERGTWKTVAAVCFALCAVTGPDGVSAAPVDRSARVAEAKPVTKPPEPKKKRASKERSVEDIIRDEWGKRAPEALRVAACESKLDARARNRSGATGVFQIMPVHDWRVKKVKGKHLRDASTNVRVARHLYKDQGWRPWTCARMLGLTA